MNGGYCAINMSQADARVIYFSFSPPLSRPFSFSLALSFFCLFSLQRRAAENLRINHQYQVNAESFKVG